MTKIKNLFISIIIGMLTIIASSCNKNEYFNINNSIINDNLSSKGPITMKIFLETSTSMKGYVNPNTPGDYKLVSYLPRLITDLENKKNGYDSLELFTITNESKRFIGSNNEFMNLLRTGYLMTGGSSILHEMIKQIIDSTNEQNNISMFISDCILDLGTKRHEKVNSERSLLTNEIYRILSQRNNLSAIVYQFYSDFNGNFYFNSINQKPNPFNGTIMHNRPFYIWVFGKSDLLLSLIKKNIINNYSNMYTFGLSNIPLNFRFLDIKIPKYINARFSEADSSLRFSKKPGLLSFGLSSSLLPSYVDLNYIKDNINVDKKFIDLNIEIVPKDSLNIFNKDNINTETEINKIKSIFHNENLQYLILLKFSELPKEDFSIFINKNNATSTQWISNSSINDDVGVDLADLEDKTFSFSEFVKAFSDTYKSDTLFSIKFKYHKK